MNKPNPNTHEPVELWVLDHPGQSRIDFDAAAAHAARQAELEELHGRATAAPHGFNYGETFRNGRVRQPGEGVSPWDARAKTAETPGYVYVWLALIVGVIGQMLFGELRCHSTPAHRPGIESWD